MGFAHDASRPYGLDLWIEEIGKDVTAKLFLRSEARKKVSQDSILAVTIWAHLPLPGE